MSEVEKIAAGLRGQIDRVTDDALPDAVGALAIQQRARIQVRIAEGILALPAIHSATEAAAALEWFGAQRCLALDFHSPVYGDDDDQSYEWCVTKEGGSINDREFDVIGRGETPLAAINGARAHLQPKDPAR